MSVCVTKSQSEKIMGSAADFIKNNNGDNGDHRELPSCYASACAVAHAMQFRQERRVGDGEHLIAVCHADEVLDDVGVDPV